MKIKKLNLPEVENVGYRFLFHNCDVTSFEAINLKITGDCFLCCNKLVSFDAPMLEKVGESFMHCNISLLNFRAPNLEEVGVSFLFSNRILANLKAPKVVKADYFLFCHPNRSRWIGQ